MALFESLLFCRMPKSILGIWHTFLQSLTYLLKIIHTCTFTAVLIITMYKSENFHSKEEKKNWEKNYFVEYIKITFLFQNEFGVTITKCWEVAMIVIYIFSKQFLCLNVAKNIIQVKQSQKYFHHHISHEL